MEPGFFDAGRSMDSFSLPDEPGIGFLCDINDGVAARG
jgi:hypothetical protein